MFFAFPSAPIFFNFKRLLQVHQAWPRRKIHNLFSKSNSVPMFPEMQADTIGCIAVLLLFIGTNAGEYSGDLVE